MEVVQSFSKATFRCNRTFDNVTHMKNTKNKLLCNSFCRQSISRNFRRDKESVVGFHCYAKKSEETSDSVIVRKVVDGVTELLRLFSQESTSTTMASSSQLEADYTNFTVDQVLDIIRKDYSERAYFLTGKITEEIYDENCFFGDPTISFTGREKWKKNINLLVPFFEEPSIELKEILKGEVENFSIIETKWRLRTYLRLPWRPLIDVNGSTNHYLNSNNKVFRHIESWEISGLAAIGQIFVPSTKK